MSVLRRRGAGRGRTKTGCFEGDSAQRGRTPPGRRIRATRRRLTACWPPRHRASPSHRARTPQPRHASISTRSSRSPAKRQTHLLLLDRVPLVVLLPDVAPSAPARRAVLGRRASVRRRVAHRRAGPRLAPRDVAGTTSAGRVVAGGLAASLLGDKSGLEVLLLRLVCGFSVGLGALRRRADVACSASSGVEHLLSAVRRAVGPLEGGVCCGRPLTRSREASRAPTSRPRSRPWCTSGSTPRDGDLIKFPTPPRPVETWS